MRRSMGTTGWIFGIAGSAVVLVSALAAALGLGRTSPVAAATRTAQPEATAELPQRAEPLSVPEHLGGASSAREHVAVEELGASSTTLGGSAETPGDAGDTSLMAEITALLRSGRVEAHLSSSGASLQAFLVDSLLEVDDARGALDVLRRYPVNDSAPYFDVGYALREQGDAAGASEMLLAALELDTFDGDLLEALSELDPAGALAMLDQRVSPLDLGGTSLAFHRVRLLVASGRREEGLAQLEAIVALTDLDPDVLDEVRAIDPAIAERMARERLEGTQDESSDPFALALAEMLAQSERSAEAVTLLETVLARGASNAAALEILFEVDPARALARTEALMSDPSFADQDLLILTGEFLHDLGRTEEAIDAWIRAATPETYSWGALALLRQHAPDRWLAHTRVLASSTSDDELLGDVADSYWDAGLRDEAIELWKRANRIDPSDDEWTEKIVQAVMGGDPDW